MSKTPVSVLQEYAVKSLEGLPEYIVQNHNSGSHNNQFTYQVKYGKLVAYGTASTKKEAKQRGAKAMLELLPQLRSSHNIDSRLFPEARSVPDSAVFVNSVGSLNEFCAINKLKCPEYQVVDMVGPSHAIMFTMVCTIGELESVATANTKKQAKQDAAQKMLNDLVRNTSYVRTHNIRVSNDDNCEDLVPKLDVLNLKVEVPSVSNNAATQIAKQLYPVLQSYMGRGRRVSSTIDMKNLHVAFKNSIEPSVRLSVRTFISKKKISASKEEILDHVVSLLDHRVETDVLFNSHNRVIVACTLDCNPVIVDIGIGQTVPEAQEKAIAKLLDSIDLLLS